MNVTVSGIESESMITKIELANKLHLHPNTIENLIARGELEGCYRIGNSYRFQLSEVMESIRKNSGERRSRK
jgi:excisionase family DNA binding protein